MTTRTRRSRVPWLVALAGLVLVACGSDSDGAASTAAPANAAITEAPDTTGAAAVTEAVAAPDGHRATGATGAAGAQAPTEAPAATGAPTTTAPAPIVVPEGTILRVGDQQGTLQRPLEASGESANLQSEVEYAAFVGGPAILEAFRADAIDIAYVGDTPPILAAASGQDIVVVGAWHFSGKVLAVVSAPGTEIASVADLAGRTFAYPKGTALQAFALAALDEAGLGESDIEQVEVSAVDVLGVLQSGAVDAAVVIEPLLTAYLRDNPEATVVRDATGLATGLQFIITTQEKLDDPAIAAAIGDFVEHEAKAFVWAAENPEAAQQAFADANQITLDEAALISERNGVQLFGPIDDSVLGPLQDLADLFSDAGTIPDALDVSAVIDDRALGQGPRVVRMPASGRTMAASEPWWPERTTAPVGAPDIIVVLVDDLGFADLPPPRCDGGRSTRHRCVRPHGRASSPDCTRTPRASGWWPTPTPASRGTRWSSPTTCRRCPRSSVRTDMQRRRWGSGTCRRRPTTTTPATGARGPCSVASTGSTASSRGSPRSTTRTGWCRETTRSPSTSTPRATTSPTT